MVGIVPIPVWVLVALWFYIGFCVFCAQKSDWKNESVMGTRLVMLVVSLVLWPLSFLLLVFDD
jgi:MFS superfamily sulfate permease-like transporter